MTKPTREELREAQEFNDWLESEIGEFVDLNAEEKQNFNTIKAALEDKLKEE